MRPAPVFMWLPPVLGRLAPVLGWLPPVLARLPPPMPGADMLGAGGGVARTVAEPRVCTWRETLLRLFTEPRGTPKPAVSPRTTRRFGVVLENTGRPTATVAVPRTGGAGGLKRTGGFVTGTTVAHPPPKPPGAHIQP